MRVPELLQRAGPVRYMSIDTCSALRPQGERALGGGAGLGAAVRA